MVIGLEKSRNETLRFSHRLAAPFIWHRLPFGQIPLTAAVVREKKRPKVFVGTVGLDRELWVLDDM